LVGIDSLLDGVLKGLTSGEKAAKGKKSKAIEKASEKANLASIGIETGRKSPVKGAGGSSKGG